MDDSGAPGAELFLKDAALEVLRGSHPKSVGCGLVSADRKGCCCRPLLKTEIAFIRIRDQNKQKKVTRNLFFFTRIFGLSQFSFAL